MADLAGAGGGAKRKARQAVASCENKGTCLNVHASLYKAIDGLDLSQQRLILSLACTLSEMSMLSSETAFFSSSVEFWGTKTNSSFNSYGMAENRVAIVGGVRVKGVLSFEGKRGGLTISQNIPASCSSFQILVMQHPGLRTSSQTVAASSSPCAVAWASRSVASAHPAKPSASCISCAEGAWIAACRNRALSVRTRVWSGRLSKSSRTTARKSVIGI